jgi:type I restriction-modification system DNA methylase subunit
MDRIIADSTSIIAARPDRKANGIYYTPSDIAYKLTTWAITSRTAVVLDPSFGSGVFLKAAIERLHQLGVVHPGKQVYGVDNDPTTLQPMQYLLDRGASADQFRFGDFLALRPQDFQRPFTVLLGNPPYVRHHTLGKQAHEVARLALAESGHRISDLASYWSYTQKLWMRAEAAYPG